MENCCKDIKCYTEENVYISYIYIKYYRNMGPILAYPYEINK